MARMPGKNKTEAPKQIGTPSVAPDATKDDSTTKKVTRGGTVALSPLMTDRPPATPSPLASDEAAPIVTTTKPEEFEALAQAFASLGEGIEAKKEDVGYEKALDLVDDESRVDLLCRFGQFSGSEDARFRHYLQFLTNAEKIENMLESTRADEDANPPGIRVQALFSHLALNFGNVPKPDGKQDEEEIAEGLTEENEDRISERDILPDPPEPKPPSVTFVPKGDTAIPQSRAGQTGETMHVSVAPESVPDPVGVSAAAASVGPPQRDVTTKPGATPPALPSKEHLDPDPALMKRLSSPGGTGSAIAAPLVPPPIPPFSAAPFPPVFGGPTPPLPTPAAPAPSPGTGMEAAPISAPVGSGSPAIPPGHTAYVPPGTRVGTPHTQVNVAPTEPESIDLTRIGKGRLMPTANDNARLAKTQIGSPREKRLSDRRKSIGGLFAVVLFVGGLGAGIYWFSATKIGEPPQPKDTDAKLAAAPSGHVAKATDTERSVPAEKRERCAKLSAEELKRRAAMAGSISNVNLNKLGVATIQCNGFPQENDNGTWNYAGLPCEICSE